MITYKRGNLLDVTEGIIIHGCNAKGVMGSGVALAVKNKYPKAYKSYKDYETNHGLRIGSLNIVGVLPNLYIANAITQESYGRDPYTKYVSYGALQLCFEKAHGHFPLSAKFHFPRIGSGLGNGDWNVIEKLIELACPNRELICWEL